MTIWNDGTKTGLLRFAGFRAGDARFTIRRRFSELQNEMAEGLRARQEHGDLDRLIDAMNRKPVRIGVRLDELKTVSRSSEGASES